MSISSTFISKAQLHLVMSELITAIVERNKHKDFYSPEAKGPKDSAQGIKLLVRKAVMDSVMTAMAHHTLYPTLKPDAEDKFGAVFSYIKVGTRTEDINDTHKEIANQMRKKVITPMSSTYRPSITDMGWGPGCNGKCSPLVLLCQSLAYMILTQVPVQPLNDSCVKHPILQGGVRQLISANQSKRMADMSYAFLFPSPNSGYEASTLKHKGMRVCYDNQIEINYSTPHVNKKAEVICNLPFLAYGLFHMATDNLSKEKTTLISGYKDKYKSLSQRRVQQGLDVDLSNISFDSDLDNDSEPGGDDDEEDHEPAAKRPKQNKTIPLESINKTVIQSARTCDQFNTGLNTFEPIMLRAVDALAQTGNSTHNKIGQKLIKRFKNLRNFAGTLDGSLVELANACFKTNHELCSSMLATWALTIIKDTSPVQASSIYDYLDILENSPHYLTGHKWTVTDAEDITMKRFCMAFGFDYNTAYESMHLVSTLSQNVVVVTLNDKTNALDTFVNWSHEDDPDDADIDSIYDKALIWENKDWTSNAEHIRSISEQVTGDVINENCLIYDLIWVNKTYHSNLLTAMKENERARSSRK